MREERRGGVRRYFANKWWRYRKHWRLSLVGAVAFTAWAVLSLLLPPLIVARWPGAERSAWPFLIPAVLNLAGAAALFWLFAFVLFRNRKQDEAFREMAKALRSAPRQVTPEQLDERSRRVAETATGYAANSWQLWVPLLHGAVSVFSGVLAIWLLWPPLRPVFVVLAEPFPAVVMPALQCFAVNVAALAVFGITYPVTRWWPWRREVQGVRDLMEQMHREMEAAAERQQQGDQSGYEEALAKLESTASELQRKSVFGVSPLLSPPPPAAAPRAWVRALAPVAAIALGFAPVLLMLVPLTHVIPPRFEPLLVAAVLTALGSALALALRRPPGPFRTMPGFFAGIAAADLSALVVAAGLPLPWGLTPEPMAGWLGMASVLVVWAVVGMAASGVYAHREFRRLQRLVNEESDGTK
jgi:hypothetical protein